MMIRSWYVNAFGRHIFFVHNTLHRRFTNKGGGYDDDEGKVTYIYGEEEVRRTV